MPAVTTASDVTQYADIVFIATPDRCIGQVAEQVAQDGGFRAGQFVFHTSGGVSVETLSPAREMGAFTGCMHPFNLLRIPKVLLKQLWVFILHWAVMNRRLDSPSK